jgi:hypothetical protein
MIFVCLLGMFHLTKNIGQPRFPLYQTGEFGMARNLLNIEDIYEKLFFAQLALFKGPMFYCFQACRARFKAFNSR